MAKKGKGNKINKIEKSIEETKKQEIIEIKTPIEEKNLLTEEEIKDEPKRKTGKKERNRG